MINMNEMMYQIIKGAKNKEGCVQLDNILKEVVDKTKIIKDSIIYDKDGSLEEENINFTKIIQMTGDWTGYEASCNELRFDSNIICPSQFQELANRLNYMLSQKHEGRKMVVYISMYGEDIELRFHTYRENETMWLEQNLEKYDVPVLYCI